MDEPQMSHRQLDDDVVMVELRGEFDVAVALDLKRLLLALIETGTRRFLIDVASSFVDSATIGVLVGTSNRLEGVGGSLVVAATHPQILESFEIAALEKIVPIVPSVDEALALLRGGGRLAPASAASGA